MSKTQTKKTKARGRKTRTRGRKTRTRGGVNLCNNSNPFLERPKIQMKGGYVDVPSWTNDGSVPTTAYYPYNTNIGNTHDPLDPSTVISTRLLPNMTSGGKRTKKNKTNKKRQRQRQRQQKQRQRGGLAFSDFIPNQLSLPTSSMGALNSASTITGQLHSPQQTTNVLPSDAIYNSHSINPLGSMYTSQQIPIV